MVNADRLQYITRNTCSAIALTIIALFLGVAGVSVAGYETYDAIPEPGPITSECVSVSPSSTPKSASSPVASPDATASTVGAGTPVTVSCLTVTLSLDKMVAGPRTISIEIVSPSSAPIIDADVVLNTRSLVMDHGISTNQAKLTEPGLYVVEKVPMGMAGEWQAEVVIARPGQQPIVVIFVVDLEGSS